MAYAVDQDHVNELFSELSGADAAEAPRLEADIYSALSHSGSDAMDFLLERGRFALEQGDSLRAVEHLTALIDHAPDFAEGYNSRAAAYYFAGLYGPAMADIAQALALEPRHFGAMLTMATILEEVGQSNKALVALQKIEDLHPHMTGLADHISRLDHVQSGAAL
jgi:tetratricopeptide (TPR) repeat protein